MLIERHILYHLRNEREFWNDLMVKELLQQLSDTHGISGNEESIYALIRSEITPYVDEILEDTMGNLIRNQAWRRVQGDAGYSHG